LPGAEPISREGHGALAPIGLLLLHGFTGNPTSLRPLAELLSARGFALELPLLPGHGTEPRDLLPTRYADWRAAAVSALDRLRARTKHVFVVGANHAFWVATAFLAATWLLVAFAIRTRKDEPERTEEEQELEPLLAVE